MESHRTLTFFRRLLFAFLAIVLTMCGLQVGDPLPIALVSSFPNDGSVEADPWGNYFFVFNQQISLYSESAMAANFSAHWWVNRDTLFVARTSGLPSYGEQCTIAVSNLRREDGEVEAISLNLTFKTSNGEREDNGLPQFPDTLYSGRLYGEMEAASALSDVDYFVIPIGSDSSGIVSCYPVNEKALYLSHNLSSRTHRIEKNKPISISFSRTGSTLRLIRSYAGVRDTSVTQSVNTIFILRLSIEDVAGNGSRLPPGCRYYLLREKL